MSVDAGSISSSVRIKLDQLNADINACKTAFDQLGGNLTKSAANYANITGKQYFAALKKIQTETDNITAAAKAGALTQQQATAKLIQLRQQELAILQRRAISEAGSNKATIDAIHNTEAGLQKLIEKQKLIGQETEKGTGLAGDFSQALGMLGLSFSAAAIVNGLRQCAEAFMDVQEAEQRFDVALKLNNMQSAKAGLTELAENLQEVAGINDAYVKSMAAKLVTEGRDEEQIKKLITASAGYSAATGREMSEMVAQLSKTFGGYAGELGEVNPAIKALTSEQLKNGAAVDLMLGRYGEFVGKVGTMKTSVSSLKEGFNDFIASIGSSTNGFDEVIDWYAKGFKNLSKAWDEATKAEKIDRLMAPLIEGRTNMTKLSSDMVKYGLTWDDVVVRLTDRYNKLNVNLKAFGADSGVLDEIGKVSALLDFAEEKAKKEAEAAAEAEKAADAEEKAAERKKKAAEERQAALDREKAAAEERKKIYEAEQKAFDDAMEKSRERWKSLGRDIQLVGKTEKEQQELRRKWEVEEIQNANITDEQKAAEIARLEVLWRKQDELVKLDATKKLAVSAEEYRDKLDALNGVVKDTVDIERARALATVDAMGVSGEAADDARDAINAYFDALERSRSVDDFRKRIEKLSDTAKDVGKYFVDILKGIDEAIQQSYDRQIEAAEESADARRELLEEQQDAERERLDAEYEHRMELIQYDGLTYEQFLQKKVADAIAAGDAEAQADAEKELRIYKEKENYEKRKADLEKNQTEQSKRLERESRNYALKLEYEAALSSWKISCITATAQAALATVEAIAAAAKGGIGAMIAAGIATGIATGIPVGTVIANKPAKPDYSMATGGIILPQAGGVSTIQAENGYPELDINGGPSGEAFLQRVADKIADAVAAKVGNQRTLALQIGMLIGTPDGYRELNRQLEKYGAVERARG